MDDMSPTTPPGGGKPIRMSSREIADLTGKRHDNVVVDIKKMLLELGEDILNFQGIYRDSMNREQTEYFLDRDHTETLLLGYSAELRLRVVRRLREMEDALSKPQAPTTAEAFAQAFRMLADREAQDAAHAAAIAEVNERVGIIEQTAPLKAKPQNAESISEVRKRMNRAHGLSVAIVNSVLDHKSYGIRPFAMVKNSHEDAQGSAYGVYWIRDISALFKRFSGETTPHSATMFCHPIIGRPFRMNRY